MSEGNETTLEIKGLENLLKLLKKKDVFVKVGVLGKTNARNDGQTNSSIGLAHEFGTSKLPQRSFLRMPLFKFFNKEVEAKNLITKDTIAEVIKTAKFRPWLEDFGRLGVGIVLDAFKTGGFGEWKPSNMKYKETKDTLVESQQLRDSITYEVKE